MLLEIKDKKVREYLKSMYLDFKFSSVDAEEIKNLIDVLRKVVNNNKMNVLNGGYIYSYVSSQLENDCNYYIKKSLELQPYIPSPENIKMIKELYKEWEYLDEWFKKNFTINHSDYGLTTITLKEIVS
ncbi:hypothetical protein KJ942_08880 [bacterium]|nr:hypothetical protein [bacterium]